MLISVDGSIQTRNYDDKNGSKRKAVEVLAENVGFVESKKDKTTDVVKDDFTPEGFSDLDDLPFI